MAGIKNASNYCFLSSLLHCVLNSNELRNFLWDHIKRNRDVDRCRQVTFSMKVLKLNAFT